MFSRYCYSNFMSCDCIVGIYRLHSMDLEKNDVKLLTNQLIFSFWIRGRHRSIKLTDILFLKNLNLLQDAVTLYCQTISLIQEVDPLHKIFVVP